MDECSPTRRPLVSGNATGLRSKRLRREALETRRSLGTQADPSRRFQRNHRFLSEQHAFLRKNASAKHYGRAAAQRLHPKSLAHALMRSWSTCSSKLRGAGVAEGIEAKPSKTEDRRVVTTSPGQAPGRGKQYPTQPVYRALQPMLLVPHSLQELQTPISLD